MYIFSRNNGAWDRQPVYVKASNTESADDQFGNSISLSSDGNTLAVGAFLEDGLVTGIDRSQSANGASAAGAVYVFRRSGNVWDQQPVYVKASNTGAGDQFGSTVSLSSDGNTLAIGTPKESSRAAGLGGEQVNNSRSNSGAVYLY